METTVDTMPIWNKRMIELIDYAVFNKMADNQTDFLKLIGISSVKNMYQIKSGKQSFRHEHFMNACIKFGVSMDWFYGFTNVMKRTVSSKSKSDPIQLIKDALVILESTPQQNLA